MPRSWMPCARIQGTEEESAATAMATTIRDQLQQTREDVLCQLEQAIEDGYT